METSDMTPEESVLFDDLLKQYQLETDTASRNSWLKKFYKREDVSFVVKKRITNHAFRVRTATEWGYQFLSGQPLFLLIQCMPLKEHLVKFAVKNPNYEVKHIVALLTIPKNRVHHIQTAFVKDLNMEALTPEVVATIVQMLPKISVRPEVAYARAREVLGFDADVPDSWIAQAMKAPEPAV